MPIENPVESVQSLLEDKSLRTSENVGELKESIRSIQKNIVDFELEVVSKLDSPDFTPEEFGYLIHEQGDNLKIPDSDIPFGEALVDTYAELYAETSKLDDMTSEERFEALFGRKPAGRVQIIKDNISVFVRCERPEDYVYVASGKSLNDPGFSDYERDLYSRQSGIAGVNGCVNPILGKMIFAQNARFIKYKELPEEKIKSSKTYTHEKSHIYDQFMRIAEERALGVNLANEHSRKLRNLTYDFNYAESSDAQKRSVLDFAREMRNEAERKLQSEILAMIIDGTPTWVAEFKTKLPLILTGYNYLLKEDESYLRGQVATYLGRENKDLVNTLFSQAFKTEANKHVKDAFSAVNFMIKNGYDRDYVVTFLRNYPLRHWKKVAERYLEA